MRKHFFVAIVACLAAFSSQAQFNLGFDHYDDIDVVHGNDSLALPWGGGLNIPQFSSIDANLDGLLDIYAYERDGNVTRFFLSEGQSTYAMDMHLHHRLPNMKGSFVLMRDYNFDGKVDIFTSDFNDVGFRIYKNISDTNLTFSLAKGGVKYARTGASSLYFNVASNDLPAIEDIDGDGDLDVIIQGKGLLSPMTLHYIPSQSMEMFGTPDSIRFRLKSMCWGSIKEVVSTTGWIYEYCDTGNVQTGGPGNDRHGVTTTLTAADVNGDGLYDILTGDTKSPHLTSLINLGSNEQGTIDTSLTDTLFPSYSTSVNIPSVIGAYIIDIDHDGFDDMIAAPNQLSAPSFGSIDTSVTKFVDSYYRNTGSASAPNFQLEKQGFFSSEMIDVGARSMPSVIDINGDGLLDVVIGRESSKMFGSNVPARLTLYLNVGTSTHPILKLEEENFAGVSELNLGYAHPTFTDLDDDGDYDLLVGDDQGRLHYYKNKGVATIYDFHLNETNFAGIDVERNAHPYFFDLNQDALEDLIIGDYYGQFHYYENAGTETEHDFSKNPTIEKMGDVQTFGTYGGDATPYVTRKLDSLGASLYIMIGSAKGNILVYGPITNIYASLTISDSISLDATQTCPVGGNFFGDFRDELLIGQRTGGLFALRRTIEIGVGSPQPTSFLPNLEVFPNPSTGLLNVQLPAGSSPGDRLTISDASGKEVVRLQVDNSAPLTLDLTHLQNGVYTLSLARKDRTFKAQWIKL